MTFEIGTGYRGSEGSLQILSLTLCLIFLLLVFFLSGFWRFARAKGERRFSLRLVLLSIQIRLSAQRSKIWESGRSFEMEVMYVNEKPFNTYEKANDREKKIEEFDEDSGIDINTSQPEIEFEKVCKKFPLNLRLSEFISEDLMNHRKRRIIEDAAALFPQRSLRDVIRNVVISHSELWKINGLQENTKTIAYLKGLLTAHLSMLDDFVNQSRLRSHKSTLRTLEPSGSPLSVADTSLQKFKSTTVQELKFSKMKYNFGQGAISTFSGQPALSGETSITKGNLQCTQKGGLPCFIFSVDDAPHPQVIYMADRKSVV